MKDKYFYKRNPVVTKIFLAMLAPTILMNLTTAIGSMADTVIIGHYLDDASLSVVTFATPVYMIINMLAALFAVGGCIVMSIESGKGNKINANKAFSVSMELMFLAGAVLLLTGLFFINFVTRCLGADESIFDQVKTYTQIILVGAPVFIFNIGFAFFVRNDGRPTLSMVGMFTSIVVDIILNVVFVGMLDMGVSGAAYSTVIGQLLSVLIISSHFFSKKNTLKFKIAVDSSAFRIIKNGSSSALNFVYQFATILIINHFLSHLAGVDGVVIYTVVFNLSTVSLSVFEGISQTIQPMVSTYYGEKSYKHIRETMRCAFVAVFIICGVATVALEIFPKVVPVAFGLDNAELIVKSAEAVRIYATSMIITTVNVVIGYYLQSTEQNSFAAILISLRSFVLFLGATVLLGKLFSMNGVWAAYVVAEGLTFVICVLMLCIKRRKHLKNGVKKDILLLDEEIKSGSNCRVFDCQVDDIQEFTSSVCSLADPHSADSIKSYLKILQKLCTDNSKNKLISVEINKVSKSIIIRDNLCHDGIKAEIQKVAENIPKSEYGPVLGWNRICF